MPERAQPPLGSGYRTGCPGTLTEVLQVTTLDFLLGNWSIDRKIADRRHGTLPAFTGEAVVSRLGPGEARYDEWGTFTDGNGYRGRAQRTLLYRTEGASSLRVCFADGRPFHDLELSRGACEVEHGCGADLYRIAFAVSDENTLLERWQVRGPLKDYDAETAWRRAVVRSVPSGHPAGRRVPRSRVVEEEARELASRRFDTVTRSVVHECEVSP
jgi:hypothetical protein